MKRFLLTIIAATLIHMPATALERDTIASGAGAIPVKFSAVVDMQVEKKLYDEYGSAVNTTRFTTQPNGLFGYRQAFDDFWMRVAIKGSCRYKNLESAFNVRFYPYWTLRRKVYIDPNNGTPPNDLLGYLDVIELNQAYVKVFKEYSPQTDLTFQPHFKIGRDGLLSGCSQLFGNYLDQPTGGYGAARTENVVGPFKNRKIFANQIEAGFAFNAFNTVSGTTSLMIGGNVNNDRWYEKSATQYYQLLDSKLTAGFIRAYQDLYLLNKRYHIGGGFRNYSAPTDSGGILIANNFTTVQCAFDVAIINDVKFYTEMAMQEMSSDASTGIVRPINVGITLPTFGVLDTLAVEFENVAKTFISDQSMRDPVYGRLDTRPLGWGIVVEKRYFNKVVIDWGLYSGNPTGDMKTTLRLTGMLN
jgi:hypothetical protein